MNNKCELIITNLYTTKYDSNMYQLNYKITKKYLDMNT